MVRNVLYKSFQVTKILYCMGASCSAISVLMHAHTGHVILSGCSNGVVAISNPSTGLVVRVITDHQGAPITDMHTSSKPVTV